MSKLEQAARHYMSVFGQALEAHGIPFSKDQLNADAALREALMESNISEHKLEQQAEQEPVAYVYEKDVAGIGMRKDVAFTKHVEVGTDLYAAPVRTKDLTDNEIHEAIINFKQDPKNYDGVGSYRAVIAKFKEKNK